MTPGRDAARGERGPVRGGGASSRAGGGLTSTPGVVTTTRGGLTSTPGVASPNDAFESPATTRIGPGGGPGGRMRTVVALVVVALLVAVVKPWDWISAPPVGPGREGAAIQGSSPTIAPTPAPSDWTDLSTSVACLSGGTWLAVADLVDGPTVARSWTRLDLVPATGPTDPAIAHIHVYAESVPRIGFCAPTGIASPGAAGPGATGGAAAGSGAAGSGAAGGTVARPGAASFSVRVWRLVPAAPALGSRAITEVVPVPVSGGTLAGGGALYGPPGSASPRAARPASPDPEHAWAVGGGLAPRPAGWSPGRGMRPAAESWPPGTYVFRVELAGAGPGGSDSAWFAIELRGPWTGPTDAPESDPTIAAPGPTPGSSSAP